MPVLGKTSAVILKFIHFPPIAQEKRGTCRNRTTNPKHFKQLSY